MTTKNKNTGVSSKTITAKPVIPTVKVSALQKALNVVNSYRAAIHKHKKADYDLKNKKGFNDVDDVLFLKNLHNMLSKPYSESDILGKKLNFGEGVIVFKDGQKYAIKKESDHFVIAN